MTRVFIERMSMSAPFSAVHRGDAPSAARPRSGGIRPAGRRGLGHGEKPSSRLSFDISNNVRYLRVLKVKSAGVPVKNPPGDLFDRPRHGDGPAPWNHSVEIDQTSRYLAGESCPPA
jgi:hypothetical protein